MAFQDLFGGGEEKGGGEKPAAEAGKEAVAGTIAEAGKEAAAGTTLQKSIGTLLEFFKVYNCVALEVR